MDLRGGLLRQRLKSQRELGLPAVHAHVAIVFGLVAQRGALVVGRRGRDVVAGRRDGGRGGRASRGRRRRQSRRQLLDLLGRGDGTKRKRKEQRKKNWTDRRDGVYTYVLDLVSVFHIVELRQHAVQQLQRSLHVVRGSETMHVLNVGKQ